MKSLFSRKSLFLSLGILSTLALIVASPLLIHSMTSHDECTSWIAMGDALRADLRGNKTILHKNRDLSDNDPANHQFKKVNTGLYKYIAMTDDKDVDKLYVWGGINETGLACAANLGNGAYLFGTIGGPTACREILEDCNSVECAYQWIAANKSKFYLENIMFFADPRKGAVVEVGVNSSGTMSITSQAESIFDSNTVTVTGQKGLNFRSNHFQIRPNNFGYSTNSGDRYDRLLATLADSYYGNIDVDNSQYIGSLSATEGKEDAFCRTSTLGRMTFEIDHVNPLNSILWHGDGYATGCSQEPIENHFDQNPIVTYTFVGTHTNIKIYACDVDKFPFGGDTANLNSKTEATASAYTNISLPDSLVWTTAKPGTGDEMMLWVDMTIKEAPANIQRIEFVFQGYPSEGNDFVIYVKNASGVWQNDSSWIQLGTAKSFTSGKTKSIRRVLDTNIANYIDANGKITWMVGTPKGDNDSITANIVKMEVVLR